jgi:FMN phosphatase YigB (HAD superfamily)
MENGEVLNPYSGQWTFFIDVDRTLATFPTEAGEKAASEYLSTYYPRLLIGDFQKIFSFARSHYHGNNTEESLIAMGRIGSYAVSYPKEFGKLGFLFSRELFINYISEEQGLKFSGSHIMGAIDSYWAAIARESKLYEDAKRFLESNRNSYIIAGSDRRILFADGNMSYDPEYSRQSRIFRTKATELSSFFDESRILTGDPYDKPGKEFWEGCMKAANLASPSSGVVIDDSLAIVASAKQFGFKGVLLDRAGRYNKALVSRQVDKYITSFDQLATF